MTKEYSASRHSQAHIGPLSAQATSVWAKTGGQTEWLPLAQHMLDSFHISQLLYEHWLSRSVKERWARAGFTPEDLLAIVTFLAMVHDVGKASPVFVTQSEPLAQRVRDAGLPCPVMVELKDHRKVLPHSLISQYALEAWLTTHGVPTSTARAYASVAGAHHGRPVPAGHLKQARRRTIAVGAAPWDAVRVELIDWAARTSGFDRVLADGLHLPPLPLLVEVSGFVIVADWLASNTRLFPLRDRADEGTPADDMTWRTEFAWDEIGMPPAWEPPLPDQDADAFFRERFFPDAHGATPHPIQRTVFELARDTDVGLIFIETVTGGGKTEAALAAAEVLAARRGSQGILVALPTQATTNSMFNRVTEWIDRLPAAPPEVSAWALTLGHGKSMLNPEYAKRVKEFSAFDKAIPDSTTFSAMHEEEGDGPPHLCNAVVHQWFLSAKRRLLANFSVVTIDQLLMAALQRKHLMLAHVALSGKVVIIDEAHASDDFMNVYLDSILSWLGAYDVPLIVLSATLTAERRKAMMTAYAGHRAEEIAALTFDPHDYPLVTVVPSDEAPIQAIVVPDQSRARSVAWAWHPTDLEAVVASVIAALKGTGCALVVRNTVADAQATASALAQAGLPVSLNHAGFLAADRAANDADLTFHFGKKADGVRPDLAVVVATQVVEQSLDVDFDVLFTDVAPIDLLIQRIGRLHRHARIRPSHLSEARCHVLADLTPDEPPAATPGTLAVYGEHLVLRTVATLSGHGDTISLPADVSPLVASALGPDPVGPSSWQAALTAAADKHRALVVKQRDKARTWCIAGWLTADDDREHLGAWLRTEDAGDCEEIQMGATVRDTNPSVEVLVIPTTPDGTAAIRPPWLADDPHTTETLDTSSLPSDDLAREIASWSVRLPSRMTPRWAPERVDEVISAIDSLPETRRWVWRRHTLLKGELLLPMRQTDEGSTKLSTHLLVKGRAYTVRYSPERGLEVSEE